jgi:pimeloyl-ACP methyl ester carboxylesterase
MQGNMEFKTSSAYANGLRFTWLELGSGPVVLALHGFPDLPRTFRHQMQALAQAGYRVIAPSMRGYFPTEAPRNAPYELAALVQDTLALIDALSDQPIVLIGHDWGAEAAYGAAVLAPEKIAKLITLAVPYGGALWQAFVTNPAQQRRSWYIFFFQMPEAEEAVAYNEFAFLEQLWREWSPGWAFPAEELHAVKATFQQPGVLTAALSYYRHSSNGADHHPALQAIRERYGEPISVPTLYIHGGQDGCIGVETTEGMEHWFQKGFTKYILAGAGHFVHQERPEEVNRLLLEFLAA